MRHSRRHSLVRGSWVLCLGAAFLAISTPLQGRQAQPPPAGAAAAQSPAAGGASATAAPQIPAAPPARPPAINRVNELMPWWLRVRGEFRERMEGFDGLGFNSTREDLYYLSRLRLHAVVTPARLLSFQVQAQDARVARKTVGPTGTPFKAPLDLRMAFADVGNAQRGVALRVGRQELAYGEQRLVGHVSWQNAARTFDAARLSVRSKAFQVDLFGASVVRILDGELDKSGNGSRFAGAYAVAPTLVPNASVEPYVLWKRDVNLAAERGGLGTLQVATLGVRWVGRLPKNFEYNTETAVQTGSLAGDDVSAWAGHYQVRTPGLGALAFRTSAEANYASGDEDPADGTRGTFDQLFPTPHDKYGLADQVGWRNIRHVRAGVELTPFKALPVTANYHSWWVNETRDGLYNAGGALLARLATSAGPRHVGHEIDVQATRALTPQFQVAAGYAHIFPGAFLEQATPGASYSHPYVMATYVFLAER